MRGNNDVIEEELYQGTAKAVEGCAIETALGFAKSDDNYAYRSALARW